MKFKVAFFALLLTFVAISEAKTSKRIAPDSVDDDGEEKDTETLIQRITKNPKLMKDIYKNIEEIKAKEVDEKNTRDFGNFLTALVLLVPIMGVYILTQFMCKKYCDCDFSINF